MVLGDSFLADYMTLSEAGKATVRAVLRGVSVPTLEYRAMKTFNVQIV